MKRLLSVFLVFSLLIPVTAAPPPVVPAGEAPPVEEGAANAQAVGASNKSPMIEVSVDSLEITEQNNENIGVNWGQTVAMESNQIIPTLSFYRLNFGEAPGTTTKIFKFDSFLRTAIQAQLTALIQNNQARILANPTLMTKSGFEATFLVGGEIPYPVPAPVGQAPGVEFKKYGVALKILPTITARNTIEAQINLGVTNPDDARSVSFNDTIVPALSTRESSSKVEVADGETVVLAGIKQSNRSKVTTKIPILGSIPLLGWFFRTRNETVTQTSLVQFVTFRIVK